MDFSGKTIAIGVTGSIAAYKVCDLVRELYRRNAACVYCLMTPSAQAFISPLTLQALSRQPVYTSELSVDDTGVPWHILLAQRADALLIMPATAGSIAALAAGLADDPVTTTAITFTDKPVLIAPAMNTRMWQHPLTRRNLETLRTVANYTVIEPASGSLACGETGDGHIADAETVLLHLDRALTRGLAFFKDLPVLITAGGTSEAIDPVRAITNRSSGLMGLALADALYTLGAIVTLLTSRPVDNRPYRVEPFKTADDLHQATRREFPTHQMLIMAAAVSDYRPAMTAAHKLKREKHETLSIELVQNPDIVAEMATSKQANQWVVGFAAESQNLLTYAAAKLQRKRLDAIIANDISHPDSGFESPDNAATVLFSDGSQTSFPQSPKPVLALSLLKALATKFAMTP